MFNLDLGCSSLSNQLQNFVVYFLLTFDLTIPIWLQCMCGFNLKNKFLVAVHVKFISVMVNSHFIPRCLPAKVSLVLWPCLLHVQMLTSKVFVKITIGQMQSEYTFMPKVVCYCEKLYKSTILHVSCGHLFSQSSVFVSDCR